MNKKKRSIEQQLRLIKWLVAIILLGSLLLAGFYVYEKYTITTVYVEGNVHYTVDEIKDMVMNDSFSENSLYLALKYKKKGITDIPFISAMEVTIVSPDTIRITVYEKSLAGYVEYLGRYMYFDKDGTIVESSEEKTEGIPLVTGLKFNHVVLYESLPVEKEEVFAEILDTTQMLKKYGLSADRIYFDENYEMTIYFEKVKVDIGENENMDDKFMLLTDILDKLQGKSGVLRLENYSLDTKNVTFEPDKG